MSRSRPLSGPAARFALPTGEFRTSASLITGREIALIAAFWLLFALVTFANRALDPRRPGTDQEIWLATSIVSLTQAMTWAILTVPLFILAARTIADDQRRVLRVLLLVVAVLVAALIASTVVDAVRDAAFPQARRGGFGRNGFGRGGGGPPRSRPWWSFGLGGFQFLNDVSIAMGVIAGGFARAYSLSSRLRQEQASQLKAQLAEARLDALRRQLDPHFLFNTLHAVSSLVERDPRGVRRMISRLSDLLRHSIEDASEPEIALSKELELLTRYIEIMQVRFQGALEVQTNVAPDAADALVPNMILQPIVENAIRHGVERVGGAGRIVIDVRREQAVLVLSVKDNGPGPDRDAAVLPTKTPGGVGVRNTMARLQQLYGAKQSFIIAPAEGGGTLAEVRLPYHTASDLRTTSIAENSLAASGAAATPPPSTSATAVTLTPGPVHG